MTSELSAFRHITEPLGGYQLRSIDFSADGHHLAIAGSSTQPAIYDRDGRKLTQLMRGDPYLRDMTKTKGHVAGCTAAKWHPTDANTLATASEDGTVRLWDASVACERGDDASSLSVQSGLRTVMVLRDARGIKSGASSIAWHEGGQTIMCGARDGSLQLWEMRSRADFQPVVLLKNATPKVEWSADKVKAQSVCRTAHAAECDISCVRWHRDGQQLASRSTDGSLKLWDLRRFDAPLAQWASLPNLHAMAGCDFSPDGSMIVTGNAVKKGEAPRPHIRLDACRLRHHRAAPHRGQRRRRLALAPAHQPDHRRLGRRRAMSTTRQSSPTRGAALRRPRAAEALGRRCARATRCRYTRHMRCPCSRTEEADHRKAPPGATRPVAIPEAGGRQGGAGARRKLSVGHQQALLASMSGGVSGLTGTKDKIAAFKVEDPREEILKYAKIAAEDPHYVTPAYAVNQPATSTAPTLLTRSTPMTRRRSNLDHRQKPRANPVSHP